MPSEDIEPGAPEDLRGNAPDVNDDDGGRHAARTEPGTMPADRAWSTARWSVVLAVAGASLAAYLVVVLVNADHVSFDADYGGAHGGGAQLARAGYCSVPGNTAPDGSPLQPGTFLDLVVGEPARDSRYTGATPAIFIKGIGLTCSVPPTGYVRHGFAADAQHIGTGIYPYYVPGGG